MRDLPWLIDSLQCDHLEDDDDVNGSWVIRWQLDADGNPTDVVLVLFRPYPRNAVPADMELHPPKATKYRVTLLEEVEGDNAEEVFESWKK